MAVLPDLIAANERFAATFDKGHLRRPPAREVAILTCLDARITPLEMLGLEPGDANVIRNAGGRAADAIRSLIVSTTLLGAREVLVIHHTDCGLFAVTNQQIHDRIATDLGDSAAACAAKIDFLPFNDLVESVHEDVELIRSSPLIPNDVEVSGFVYDVQTGKLERVD